MTRAEKVAEAQRLRAEGLLQREIGERMGAKRSAVSAWLTDPDLSKQRDRRRRYAGSCVDCGAPTDGSDGPRRAAQRCEPCHRRYQASLAGDDHPETIWTRALLIERIQEWATIYGEPPAMPDWNPWVARSMNDEERAKRFEAQRPYWPWYTSVVKRFGTWSAGLEAAGFKARIPNGGGGNQEHRRRRAQHGSTSMYKKGCRCNACKAASRASHRKSYHRRKLRAIA